MDANRSPAGVCRTLVMRFGAIRWLRGLLLLAVAPLAGGCGWGYLSVNTGCYDVLRAAVVVEFVDRDTGRPLAVDAFGSIAGSRFSESLVPFEQPPGSVRLVYSLQGGFDLAGVFDVTVTAAVPGEPAQTIIFEDVVVAADACGPITRFLVAPI